MRSVNIISAVYPPEPIVSGRMAKDLADYLSQDDIVVTVLCPQPSRPLNSNYKHLQNSKSPIIQLEDRIMVIRLPSFASPRSKIILRVRESYSFGQYVCRYIKGQPSRPDLLYVNGWPLLSQGIILHFAQRNKIPVVLQIMDVYPESLLIKLPVWIRSFFGPILTRLDRWIASQAASIVVISENMRRIYLEDRKINEKKVKIINLWQDDSLFARLPRRQEGCRFYAIPEDKFTFMYLGNIGPVAGVHLLIHAFNRAQIDGAQLIIAGDGSSKAACSSLAKKLGSASIKFLVDPDFRNTALIQSVAHVCLLPLRRGAGLSSVPSKLIAYMFSGKPVIATVDAESETARIIRKTSCGWLGDPDDLDWLVDKMREVAISSTRELEVKGERGRQYCQKEFAKSTELKKLVDLLHAAFLQ